MQRAPALDHQREFSTKSGALHDHRDMITIVSGMGRLVKPCACGAPQAASGLDQPPHPGAGLTMFAMPHPATSKPPFDTPHISRAMTPIGARVNERPLIVAV